MRLLAIFNCFRVRGNFLQLQEDRSRGTVMLTVGEGTTRATIHLDPKTLRQLAIFGLQRAEDLSP